MLFGKDRLAVFPDARIRLAGFGGTDRTRIVDSQDMTSHLPTAVEEVLAFIQRNTRRGIRIDGIRHEMVPEFPQVSLREAVINAIVHADYGQHGSPLRVAIFSDRIPPALALASQSAQPIPLQDEMVRGLEGFL